MKKYLCKSIAVAMISITLFSSVGTVNTFAVENPEISIASEEVIKLGVTSKINATPSTKSIKLSWKKVANATGYRVYIYKNNKWTKLANTNKTTYTVKSLKSGTNYKLAVKAYSKTDDGTVWADSYKTVSAMTKLDKTSKITATTTESSVKLSWKKVTGATGYRVYIYKNNKWTKLTDTAKTSYTVKSLKARTDYKFAVKAYCKTKTTTIWSESYTTITAKTILQTNSDKKTGEYATINGKKYPLYIDSNGKKYYINQYGSKIIYRDSVSSTTNNYTGDQCRVCGKTTCNRVWDDYYCKICKKTIPGFSCHPKAHYEASK